MFEILRHYLEVQEAARLSFGVGLLELARTQEILRRHLPPPPARVCDLGARRYGSTPYRPSPFGLSFGQTPATARGPRVGVWSWAGRNGLFMQVSLDRSLAFFVVSKCPRNRF